MRKKSSIHFAVFLSLWIWSISYQALSADSVRVEGVIDGDTIVISGGQRVRYLGIDAPEREGKEPAEFLARESMQLNRRLVFEKRSPVGLWFGKTG